MPKTKKKQKNKNNIRNKSKLAVDKQKTPRNKEKYPALNFKRQVKTRLEQLDCDYVDKLNDKEKAFLNAFLEETVITNFDHKGKLIYKDRKPFYDANNARNRCMYTKALAMGKIANTNTIEALNNAIDNTVKKSVKDDEEDAMILAIALKRSGNWEESED
jgi:hypothetical protein